MFLDRFKITIIEEREGSGVKLILEEILEPLRCMSSAGQNGLPSDTYNKKTQMKDTPLGNVFWTSAGWDAPSLPEDDTYYTAPRVRQAKQ